jgi:hypothetical protein
MEGGWPCLWIPDFQSGYDEGQFLEPYHMLISCTDPKRWKLNIIYQIPIIRSKSFPSCCEFTPNTPQMNQRPPYRPTVWSLGGRPTKNVDIPITAVFLLLFIIGAATHMTIFQLNRRRGHKFIFNAALFGMSFTIASTRLY